MSLFFAIARLGAGIILGRHGPITSTGTELLMAGVPYSDKQLESEFL